MRSPRLKVVSFDSPTQTLTRAMAPPTSRAPSPHTHTHTHLNSRTQHSLLSSPSASTSDSHRRGRRRRFAAHTYTGTRSFLRLLSLLRTRARSSCLHSFLFGMSLPRRRTEEGELSVPGARGGSVLSDSVTVVGEKGDEVIEASRAPDDAVIPGTLARSVTECSSTHLSHSL